jgi:hypothetical protein
MIKGLHILAEALARIEHKIDLLFNVQGAQFNAHPLMQFPGNMCPVCKGQVRYVIDIQHNMAKRMCGCTTGVVATDIDLTPYDPQKQEGAQFHGGSGEAQDSEDPAQRKAR